MCSLSKLVSSGLLLAIVLSEICTVGCEQKNCIKSEGVNLRLVECRYFRCYCFIVVSCRTYNTVCDALCMPCVVSVLAFHPQYRKLYVQ